MEQNLRLDRSISLSSPGCHDQLSQGCCSVLPRLLLADFKKSNKGNANSADPENPDAQVPKAKAKTKARSKAKAKAPATA